MSFGDLATSWVNQKGSELTPVFSESDPVLFPFNSLPIVLQEYCHELGRVTQAPLEFSSLVCLGIMSACVSKGAVVKNCYAGLDGLPTLQIAIAQDSGSGKTLVFKHVAKALFDWCHEDTERYKKEIYYPLVNRISFLKSRLDSKLKEARRRNVDPETQKRLENEAKEIQIEIGEAEEGKAVPTYTVEDITLEAMAVILANNGRIGQESVFSISDDARQALNVMLGKYSKTQSIDDNLLVKGFSWSTHNQHRRAEDGTAVIRAPCVPVLWLIQPDLLTKLTSEIALSDSGFLQRFILDETDWPVEVYRDPGEFCPVQKAKWTSLVYDILNHFRKAPTPDHIEATPEARQRIDEYRESIKRLLLDPKGLQDIKSFAQRWAEWAWRFALLFHVITYRRDASKFPISEETATNAIQFAKYYAWRKSVILSAARVDKKKAIRDKILDRARTAPSLKPRDLILFRIAKTAEEARMYLDAICSEGLMVKKEVNTPGGGPVSIQYCMANRPQLGL